VVIGFSFKSDLEVFAKYLSRMNFYKLVKNFIDAQTFYARVCIQSQQVGLSRVAKEVLGTELCKGE